MPLVGQLGLGVKAVRFGVFLNPAPHIMPHEITIRVFRGTDVDNHF